MENIIEIIETLPTIQYNDGEKECELNLSILIIEYIERKEGSKTLNTFMDFLSSELTLNGARNLLLKSEEAFLEYKTYKMKFIEVKEYIIISEFKSILEDLIRQFEDVVSAKEKIVKTYTKKEYLEVNNNEFDQKEFDQIYDSILNNLKLESQKSSKLARFSTKELNKEIIQNQIKNYLDHLRIN